MATILIVDDLPASRDYLAALLEHHGHRALVAQDAGQALEAIRFERPDLVISDLLMPAANGIELVKALKVQDGASAPPVILCTAAYNPFEAATLAKPLGVRAILAKPVRPRAMLEAVNAALHAPAAASVPPPVKASECATEHPDPPAPDCERHMLLDSLFERAPGGNLLVGLDGRVLRANLAFCRLLQRNAAELIGQPFGDLVAPADGAAPAALAVCAEAGEAAEYPLRAGARDGADGTVWTRIVSSLVSDAAGQPLYILAQVQDIGLQRQIEDERAAHARQLAELSRRLVAVQEQERRRLAAEFHDRINGNLAAAKINLGLAMAHLPQPVADEVGDGLADARALIEDAEASVRQLCTDLHPPRLAYGGLRSALEGYAQQFSARTGIAVTVRGGGDERRLPAEAETVLFRIAQEALHNCARHAQATQVAITLETQGTATILAVHDNGIGFDPSTIGGRTGTEPGVGLLTMRERAEFMGASFCVESQRGNGTRVAVAFDASAPMPRGGGGADA